MNEDSIFAGALEKASPEERAAFLEGACAGDDALRARVEALLAAHEKADSLLDDRLVPVPETASGDSPMLERPGAQIGRYKLLQKIGEGGFGVVYMAEQQEPVHRRVAVKIIKPGMDSRAVVARFEAERQALAMMDHPNIAKVLDAGTTESGRPYFVMELVHGIPITKYCDDQRLSPRERLALFIPVCHAIQHAHQKGIIHRDVKPSNILVCLYDGAPVPKVIDFGVAKAIQQKLTKKTMFTQFGQVIGTLEYMSPEQAEMNQLDIDTRSDVYSLGTVLYELLTGTTPFEPKRLRSAAFDEMLRIIREEEPPRPSLRLSTTEKRASISAQRQTNPARLSRLVKGELDWIVMKALEKQRARRYETANGLAKDIERYLEGDPVEASPPSTGYRLRKFAHRYRKPLAVAVTILVLLAAATAFSSVQWARADRAAATARQAEAQAIIDRDEKERQRSRAAEAEEVAEKALARAEENESLAHRNADEARRNLYTAHLQQIQSEWNKGNVRRVRELLGKYANPPADGEDLRGWEWNYWNRMCEQELRTLKGHDGAVNAVAFNGDGALLASIGSDGKVCVWNVSDGRLVRQIDAHEGIATCVAFHGDKLASAGFDRRLRLWDATDGRELASFQYGHVISCVAFSKDGKLLAAGATSEAGVPTGGGPIERRIIDVATGKQLYQMDADSNVRGVAFTNDDTHVVFAASPYLEIWDTRTGETVKQINIDDEYRENNIQRLRTISFALSSTSEFFVTANEDHFVRIRNFSDGKTLMKLKGHTNSVMSVSLSPDEKLIASADADNTIILWDVETGDEVRRLLGHEKRIMEVTFSTEGLRLASASDDQTVRIWDAVHRTDVRPFLAKARGHYMASTFSPDGNWFAVANFGGPPTGAAHFQCVDVRDALTGHQVCETAGHSGWIDAVAISHDRKKIASGAKDRLVKIYDAATGKELRTLEGFTWSISGLSFSPNDRWLLIDTAHVDPDTRRGHQTQQLWEVETGNRLIDLPAKGLAFHPHDNVCAVASADEATFAINFYRLEESIENQTPLRSWNLDEPGLRLKYGPDGNHLAADVGNQLVVWDADDGSVTTSVASAGTFVGFDESGQRVFTHSGARDNPKLSVWQIPTGDLMCEIPLPQGLWAVNVSPDATRIATRNLPYLHMMELGPIGNDEEQRAHLEARNLAAHLLGFPMMEPPFLTKTKADVLQHLVEIQTISHSVRKKTAELIDDIYTNEEQAAQFGSAANLLLLKPDGTEDEYKHAFELVRTAYELAPELWEINLGFALYRLGRHREALEIIEKTFDEEAKRDARAVPGFLAVLAMAQFSRGMKEEALASLVKAKTDPYYGLPGNMDIVREAAALIEPESFGEEAMDRGSLLARSARWDEAIVAYEEAEKLLVGNLRARCLYYLAQAHFAVGDEAAHQQVCQRLHSTFDIANDPFAARRLAYASVLNPKADVNWRNIIQASERHDLESRLRGALHFRAGEYDAALDLLPAARAGIGSWDLAFIAMAEYRSGNEDEARKALGECETSMKEEATGQRSTDDWHGRLESQLLFDEAKQLIQGDAP